MSWLSGILQGPARVVPPGATSGRLVALVSAAMSLFATVALIFAFTADRIADGWNSELARSATLRIAVTDEQIETRTKAALQVLQTTPGIASAKVISDEGQLALLKPWIDHSADLSNLGLPRLIAVEETQEGPDSEGLRLRLAGEVPGAIYDSHGRWRGPIGIAAQSLGRAGWGAVLVSGLTLAAIILFCAQTAVRINRTAIGTLRLLGARDGFITRAFVRRITFFAFAGGAFGVLAGWFVTSLVNRGLEGGYTGLHPSGLQWIILVLLPFGVALLAYAAAHMSALRTLRRLH